MDGLQSPRNQLGPILFILYVSDLEEETCSKLVIQNQREGQSVQRRNGITYVDEEHEQVSGLLSSVWRNRK